MTQREAAIAAADTVFQNNLQNTFQVLFNNLISAHGDAEIQSAVDKAKRGIEVSQLTLTKCKELAQSLPQS
jgi:LDH2 family malate/lactate/ureidoglycolate dehydrogenase